MIRKIRILNLLCQIIESVYAKLLLLDNICFIGLRTRVGNSRGQIERINLMPHWFERYSLSPVVIAVVVVVVKMAEE